MSTLHTFSRSSAQASDMLDRCLASLAPGDSLLLLEDGVFAALPGTRFQETFAAVAAQGIRLYTLSEDLAARGISAKIPPVFSKVTYKEFVSLCLAHSKVVNWS